MKNRLPNLDALRLFLALMVVIYHINDLLPKFGLAPFINYDFLQKGSLAVDYFFSLSGFLIIGLLWREKKESGTVNLKFFYLRRIFRIFPLYYIVLAIGIIAYELIMPWLFPELVAQKTYNFSTLLTHYMFFLPNVFKSHYPEIGPILDILWSIGIEEQFYLFIPIIILILPKRKGFLGIWALFALTLIFFRLIPQMNDYYMYFFYFIFSGLLKICLENGWFKRAVSMKGLQLLFLICFILNFTTSIFEFEDYFLRHTVRMLISGFFIVTLVTNPLFIISNSLINYLGKISYGIYMYHMIVISALVVILNKLQLVLNPLGVVAFYLFSCAVIFIASHFSFEKIEQKLLIYSRRFRIDL